MAHSTGDGFAKPGFPRESRECGMDRVGVLMVGLKETAARHSDWIVISHDELSSNPCEGFVRAVRHSSV